MTDLTVLATQNDPFRVDTPARHRDGAWLADTAAELGLGDRKIHLRGLHYMMIGRPKPDGRPYTNTDEDWTWLSSNAGKAARWLGYLPFDQIVDQRNAAPEIQLFSRPEPTPYISVGIDVHVPSVDEMLPVAGVDDFTGTQPGHIVLFGEKSSLGDILGRAARRYRADVYLPTGEISDTLMHQMAATGAADGRPMVVFCFSDADPAGWQMPISISRKLQAFRASMFPELEFEVHRVALTPEQVVTHGLPSTPLKATERRGDRWTEATGTEQTEIDALASLNPNLLQQLADDALRPYFDHTLDGRVFDARSRWLDQAQAVLDNNVDPALMERLRVDATEKLDLLRAEIDTLNDALRLDVDDFNLPEPVVPTAQRNTPAHGQPLVSSAWSFAEQCARLIASKDYREVAG